MIDLVAFACGFPPRPRLLNGRNWGGGTDHQHDHPRARTRAYACRPKTPPGRRLDPCPQPRLAVAFRESGAGHAIVTPSPPDCGSTLRLEDLDLMMTLASWGVCWGLPMPQPSFLVTNRWYLDPEEACPKEVPDEIFLDMHGGTGRHYLARTYCGKAVCECQVLEDDCILLTRLRSELQDSLLW